MQQDILNIIIDEKINNQRQIFEKNLASESTIRRNLKKLEQLGFIRISYGGAIEIIDSKYISIDDKYRTNLDKQEKMKLARICADLIKEDSTIFIDNGTTVRFILQFLKNKNVTIYTNGYHHIELAKTLNLDLRLIPGMVLYKEASIVGEEALVFLSNLQLDIAFLGANGFDEKNGVTTPNFSECNLKKLALTRADKSYFVMSANKYHHVSEYKICEFVDYPIITLSKKSEKI